MQVYAIHQTDKAHLEHVKSEMAVIGAPKIHVFEIESGVYQALEGTHRLAAAAELGLTPEFVILSLDQEIGDHVSGEFQGDYPEWYLVSDLVDDLTVSRSASGAELYDFN